MKTVIAVLILMLGTMAMGQTTHSAKLSWTPSSSACVTTVNVHRALTSGGQIPIGQPNSNYATVPVGTNTYTDTAVTAGTTYYYTVSAWGSTCGGTLKESVMSNEFKATIPVDCQLPSTIVNGVCTAPPNPPTGLTGQVN